MKFVFIDVETTGVDPKLNAIHQLSAIVEIDGVVVDTFDERIKPFEGAVIEPQALIVGHVTYEELMAYQPQEIAYGKFHTFLKKHISQFNKTDKAYFIGYNVKFDNDFVRAFFERNDNKYFGSLFWSNPIDVMTTTTLKLFDKRILMENFQLMTVAKAFGIVLDESKLHNSMYDIEITRDLFYKSIGAEAVKFEVVMPKAEYCDETTKINFGKYNGKCVSDIIKCDAQYLKWLHMSRIKNIQFTGTLLEQIMQLAKIEEERYLERKSVRNVKSLTPLDMEPPSPNDDLPF